MNHCIQENSYPVQNFFIPLIKPTVAPNIRDRTKGSLMIISKNVEVSYCALGEGFRHLEGGTERNRKKYESG